MIKVNGQLISTEKFPNNESKVKDFAINQNNIVELKYNGDEDLTTLLFVAGALKDNFAKAKLFINYMPYSRMDRKIDGDLFTLKYVCEFINNLGFEKVFVLEPHSHKTEEFLKNCQAVYPMEKWTAKITKDLDFRETDHIVFPDKGARQRYQNVKRDNIITFDKSRDEITGRIKEIRLHSGEVNYGSRCLIVDDLCSRGGTFLKTAEILKQHGVNKVYLLVAHTEDTVFEGGLLDDDSPIDTIFTTNSILNKRHPKIKFINIADNVLKTKGEEVL